MERREIVEQAAMIGIILAWLVRIFTGFHAIWFHALIYYAAPVVLVWIMVVRWRRMHEGFEFSRRIVDQQHRLTGANVLGEHRSPGPQPPYPGMIPPNHLDRPESPDKREEERK